MRKIVAGLFISLDGVVEAPERWQMPYFNDEMGAEIGGLMAAADTLLLGRRTYQEFATAFADQSGDAMAEQMNRTSKLVVSTTLDTVEWQHSTLLKGNVAEEIARLKAGPGANIGMSGSVTLVRALLRDGLLDELRLLLHPLVVGGGKRLFEEGGEQVALALVDAHAFRTGVVSLTYVPAAT